MNSSLTINSITEAVSIAAGNMAAGIISFLPQIFFALTIMVIGLILARWAKTLTKKILSTLKIKDLLKDSPIEQFLSKADICPKAEDIIVKIVGWIILIIFFITAIDILGLVTVSAFLTRILAYIPKVFSATLILLIGVLAAGLVENLVKGVVSPIDIATSRLLAKTASYIMVIFAGLVALSELGIAANFINILLIGIVATLSLAAGLAFGLGAKDIVKTILENWYHSMKTDSKKVK